MATVVEAGCAVDAFIRRYRELPVGYWRELAPSADLRDFIACGWINAVRHEPGPKRADHAVDFV